MRNFVVNGGGFFMGEELILKKYSLRMKIIDKEQEAKPCLLVINNNAYNISSWQEFYKIVFLTIIIQMIKYQKNL